MDLPTLRREIAMLGEAAWTTWPHAYGCARDTPGHLAALLGDDEKAQRDAAFHFQSAIVHQGTLWPASPDALTWFLRVLRVKPLPPKVLEDCLDVLVWAADNLEYTPTGTPVPELSTRARTWLEHFAETEEWEDDDVSQEVYDWVLARTAALRPTVLDLAAALTDRAPESCATVREEWETEKG